MDISSKIERICTEIHLLRARFTEDRKSLSRKQAIRREVYVKQRKQEELFISRLCEEEGVKYQAVRAVLDA